MINESNYRSRENELKYMTYSQFNNFMNCEAAALAMVEGDWELEQTDSMLIGQYVEAYFNNQQISFEADHPEMFKLTGDKGMLKKFAIVEDLINRAKKDKVFMSFLQGEQQVIKTGEICGVPIKTKTDYLIEGERIVDLKTVKDFSLQWDGRKKVPFIESRRYDIQAYFYESVQNKFVPYYIAAITKEAVPNIEIFEIPFERINQVGSIVESLIERYADIKEHKIKPTRCECCDYCKKTKVLTGPKDYREAKWLN